MTEGSERHARVFELFQSALGRPVEERQDFLARACQGDSTLLAEVQALLRTDAELDTGVSTAAITPEAWQSIEQWFHAALSLEPSKRLAYLDAACPNKPALRQLLQFMLGTPAAYADGFLNESWQWAEGQQVGPSTVLRRVMRDWTGQVYEARDALSQQAVTLKAVRPEFAARLRDNSRTVAGMNYPGICALREVSRQDGIDYLVMELLAGVTLEERLKSGPTPQQDLLQIGIALCEILRYTHANGLVHRELSPKSIMASGDGIMLLDFGVVKTPRAESAVAERTLTALGVVSGAAAYMSPEQVCGHTIDERSDIFSVGSIL